MYTNRPDAPILHAYMASPLSPAELDLVHNDFEIGSCARFAPTHHLLIHDEVRFSGMSHVDIRQDLDQQGMIEDFLILDEKVVTHKAAWLVSRMVSQDDIDQDQATSLDDVWEVLTYIQHIPLVAINYDIGNMSMAEDLRRCNMRWPYDPVHHPQRAENTLSTGLDMQVYQRGQRAHIVAEPGDYEEASAKEAAVEIMPLGSRTDGSLTVYRLKVDVAQRHGLVPEWCSASSGGTGHADGSKQFSQPWDPNHAFPPYKRFPISLRARALQG